MPPPGMWKGCGRGIFGLSNWDPLRKPNQSHGHGQSAAPQRAPPGLNGNPAGVTLLAKYSYKANPESPIGRELSMKQGDQLTLVSDENAVWWTAANREGETGYVPATYVMKLASKPTGLPWLQDHQEQEPEVDIGQPGNVKPYVSAYGREGGNAGANKNQYYCEICDKQLNGPKPYGAHMTSKAHKEEVEYRNSCQ